MPYTIIVPYTIIKRAIEHKESLTAKYENYIRYFSPHILGDDREGVKGVLGFQYGGGRCGGLPASGAWCFFSLHDLRNVHPNGDRWRTGPLENKPLHLFAKIDLRA